MISDIISEEEFRKQLGMWLLENDRKTVLPVGVSEEDFCRECPLPDVQYIHTQSYPDKNGDLITLLKASIILKDWETKNGKESRTLTFYRILKTFSDTPESEPFPMGYIVVKQNS